MLVVLPVAAAGLEQQRSVWRKTQHDKRQPKRRQGQNDPNRLMRFAYQEAIGELQSQISSNLAPRHGAEPQPPKQRSTLCGRR